MKLIIKNLWGEVIGSAEWSGTLEEFNENKKEINASLSWEASQDVTAHPQIKIKK